MTPEEIIQQAKRIKNQIQQCEIIDGVLAEVCQFLRLCGGTKNAFYIAASNFKVWMFDTDVAKLMSIMDGFIRSIENGFLEGVSLERKAQIDVVSDILAQAQSLLETKDLHPAAAAAIAGAALEEFLRNWIEELEIGCPKHNIEAYANMLRGKDLITKQDMKEITSWSGTRNSAAHGKWDEVSDKQHIKIMFDGINLFMRKYS